VEGGSRRPRGEGAQVEVEGSQPTVAAPPKCDVCHVAVADRICDVCLGKMCGPCAILDERGLFCPTCVQFQHGGTTTPFSQVPDTDLHASDPAIDLHASDLQPAPQAAPDEPVEDIVECPPGYHRCVCDRCPGGRCRHIQTVRGLHDLCVDCYIAEQCTYPVCDCDCGDCDCGARTVPATAAERTAPQQSPRKEEGPEAAPTAGPSREVIKGVIKGILVLLLVILRPESAVPPGE